jgi:hypothetical protein
MPDFGRWTNGGDPSLNEINRTDRFLDALAAEQQVYATDSGEAELAQLLAGWRDEVREPPLMAPVTPRDAAVALTRALESRKRTRTSTALVGSVAAAVLCLGGFGAVVAGAGPGDPLYGLHTMLFGEQKQTRSDQVTLASQQLAEVQQLIDQGQWAAAQDKLQTLTTTVATVNDVEQKQELVTQWQELTVKAGGCCAGFGHLDNRVVGDEQLDVVVGDGHVVVGDNVGHHYELADIELAGARAAASEWHTDNDHDAADDHDQHDDNDDPCGHDDDHHIAGRCPARRWAAR